jgi:putative multicomponent Na+:H+ antiporter subunit B
VRSSLVVRLGAIKGEAIAAEDGKATAEFSPLLAHVRSIFGKRYMRVEMVPYANPQALHRGLEDKEIHAACTRNTQLAPDSMPVGDRQTPAPPYRAIVRVKRLYDILQAELPPSELVLPHLIQNEISVPENSARQEKTV